jgi:hypothetical protein
MRTKKIPTDKHLLIYKGYDDGHKLLVFVFDLHDALCDLESCSHLGMASSR